MTGHSSAAYKCCFFSFSVIDTVSYIQTVLPLQKFFCQKTVILLSSKMSLAVTLAAVFLSIALPLASSVPISHSIEEEDVKVDIHITVPESDEQSCYSCEELESKLYKVYK